MAWQLQGTRHLTEASFQLAPTRRGQRRRVALVLLALVVTAIVTLPLGDLFGTTKALGAAKEREAVLAAEVERLETRLAVEAATRRELEQQAVELNTRVADMAAQVEFLSSRNAGER